MNCRVITHFQHSNDWAIVFHTLNVQAGLVNLKWYNLYAHYEPPILNWFWLPTNSYLPLITLSQAPEYKLVLTYHVGLTNLTPATVQNMAYNH